MAVILIGHLAWLRMAKDDGAFEAVMAYTIWTRNRIDHGAVSDSPFSPEFSTDSGYDAVEMAIFLMNGKQKDVYIECSETGSIFSKSDMHILEHPWPN